MGRFWKIFGQNFFKFNLLATELQSDRVTESQLPKGTQYTGGGNFFVPDFNKIPYSLRSQGNYTNETKFVKYSIEKYGAKMLQTNTSIILRATNLNHQIKI